MAIPNEFVIPGLEIVSVDGSKIIIRLIQQMSVETKGHLLLEQEKRLRKYWNPQAEVFLEPKGDINELRKRLRGVKML